MIKILNWLNGTRVKRGPQTASKWGRQSAVASLPQGSEQPVTYLDIRKAAQTRPLSSKVLDEYRRGRDSVIGGFKK